MLSYQMSEVLTKENTKVLIYAEPTVYQKLSLKIRQQLSAIRILLYEKSNYQIYIDAKRIKEEITFNPPKGKSVAEAIVYTWEVQWENVGKKAVINTFKTEKAVLDAIDAYLTKKAKKKAAHDKLFGVRVWNYLFKMFGKKAATQAVEPKKKVKKAAKKVNKKAVKPKKAVEPLNLKF